MKADWVTKTADRVEANVRQRKGEGATIVCASVLVPRDRFIWAICASR